MYVCIYSINVGLSFVHCVASSCSYECGGELLKSWTYGQVTPQNSTENNVAYDQATPQISTEDNVAYGQATPQISTEDNVAYGQATPQISTEDNVAYGQLKSRRNKI